MSEKCCFWNVWFHLRKRVLLDLLVSLVRSFSDSFGTLSQSLDWFSSIFSFPLSSTTKLPKINCLSKEELVFPMFLYLELEKISAFKSISCGRRGSICFRLILRLGSWVLRERIRVVVILSFFILVVSELLKKKLFRLICESVSF